MGSELYLLFSPQYAKNYTQHVLLIQFWYILQRKLGRLYRFAGRPHCGGIVLACSYIYLLWHSICNKRKMCFRNTCSPICSPHHYWTSTGWQHMHEIYKTKFAWWCISCFMSFQVSQDLQNCIALQKYKNSRYNLRCSLHLVSSGLKIFSSVFIGPRIFSHQCPLKYTEHVCTVYILMINYFILHCCPQ